jgi:phosphosulfolactate synthase
VLAEGRESGTVGLYEPDGRVREDVVEAVIEHVGLARAIFEAPRKDQQAWFIDRFGNEVNLGNVPIQEVFGVEALRLGLRADTIALSQETAKRPGTRS